VVQKFAQALNSLSESGVLENITNGLMKMFDAKGMGDKLISTLAGVLAGLEVLPKFVADVSAQFITAFTNIKIAISVVGGILAGIFLTPTIVKGITTIVGAFINLRKAMVGVSISGVIMQAVLTGGASLVKDLVATLPAIAVAIAAGYGINAMIDNMSAGVKDIGKVPSVEDFQKRQAEIEKQMRGGGQPSTAGDAGTAGAGAGNNLGGTDTAGTAGNALKDIAQSSRETADNTQKQLDINNRVLGGGTLASRGLSKQEMADMSGGRRSGTKEIKTILVELGVAIERNMARSTANAFGNNVSRREV
jgi:hypothetical protein